MVAARLHHQGQGYSHRPVYLVKQSSHMISSTGKLSKACLLSFSGMLKNKDSLSQDNRRIASAVVGTIN